MVLRTIRKILYNWFQVFFSIAENASILEESIILLQGKIKQYIHLFEIVGIIAKVMDRRETDQEATESNMKSIMTTCDIS